MGQHRLFYMALIIVAAGIVSAQFGSYYYFQQLSRSGGATGIAVNTLINYGNGTAKWYNETDLPADWNFYNLTEYITRGHIVANIDPLLHEHYVTGINGVDNLSPHFWTLWTFCDKQNAWTQALVGADKIPLADDIALAWAYQIPYQSPLLGARTVGLCS